MTKFSIFYNDWKNLVGKKSSNKIGVVSDEYCIFFTIILKEYLIKKSSAPEPPPKKWLLSSFPINPDGN